MMRLKMKYFTVKPKGSDLFARASRNAMRAYAATVRSEHQDFANEIMAWVDREAKACANFLGASKKGSE